MKTTTVSQRRRSASSPSRSQSRPSPRPSLRPSPRPRPGPKSRTKVQSRSRTRSQTTMNKSPLDTINLDSFNDEESNLEADDPEPCSAEDVVDLTSDPAGVVDLTNDTVLVVDEDQTQSYVVSSDEEEAAIGTTTSTSSAGRQRSSGVHINCPVCMDSYHEIVDSGRLLVSTRCGHVFCSLCLRDSLNHISTCPICRKKLPKGHYHPLHL